MSSGFLTEEELEKSSHIEVQDEEGKRYIVLFSSAGCFPGIYEIRDSKQAPDNIRPLRETLTKWLASIHPCRFIGKSLQVLKIGTGFFPKDELEPLSLEQNKYLPAIRHWDWENIRACVADNDYCDLTSHFDPSLTDDKDFMRALLWVVEVEQCLVFYFDSKTKDAQALSPGAE